MSLSLTDLVAAVLKQRSGLTPPESYSISDHAYAVLTNDTEGAQTAPDMPATNTAITNDFTSPMAVTISGGTVTVIKVDGTTMGITSGTVIVPVGKTISVTYSAAPSWVWIGF